MWKNCSSCVWVYQHEYKTSYNTNISHTSLMCTASWWTVTILFVLHQHKKIYYTISHCSVQLVGFIYLSTQTHVEISYVWKSINLKLKITILPCLSIRYLLQTYIISQHVHADTPTQSSIVQGIYKLYNTI